MSCFPHYRQHDAADCGPTSLRIIAKYYGKVYSAEMLRKHCCISKDGVSMLGISDAAEYIGFRTLGVKVTFSQLVEQAVLPCILHWNQNHFVVCYKISKRGNGDYYVYISDPASQRLCYNKEQFLKCWLPSNSKKEARGVALLFEPTVDFGKVQDAVTANRHSLSFFLKYLLPYKGQLAQLVVCMFLGSALQLFFPFLTQAIVDLGIGHKNLDLITLLAIAQLTFFLAQLSVGYIRGWILLHINSRIDISLISDFLIKLMNMPLHFFETKRIGDIMQRIGDHARIKNFLMGNSLSVIFSMVNLFVLGGILAYYNIFILSIFFVGNFFYVLWGLCFMAYRRELDFKRLNQASTEQSKVIQLIQGMQDIKLNNCERQKRWEWEHVQVNLFKIAIRGLTIGQIQQAGTAFFIQSTQILISFISAKSVMEGQMTMGMMMSIVFIVSQMSAPVREFISFICSLQDAKISLERLNEIHAQEDEEQNVEQMQTFLPSDKSIYLEHVKFSYEGSVRNYVLNDVSLVIPEHKVTAVVGGSGSGKTTLIKMVQGFYQPNQGYIKVGNANLSSINPHLWRSVTGSVMQDSFIFSDTIANNIALNTDKIDRKRLRFACKIANADEFISGFPLGYETKIGMEGNGTSQGQKQRILIARAIYKNPEYIFFDEATNSLDTTNERIIMRNLKEFYKGKTVLIVAHRLSTVKGADQIVVMKHGMVVEKGTHAELIALRGEYFSLVKNQLELC